MHPRAKDNAHKSLEDMDAKAGTRRFNAKITATRAGRQADEEAPNRTMGPRQLSNLIAREMDRRVKTERMTCRHAAQTTSTLWSETAHTLVGKCPYFGREVPTLCSISVYTLLNECSLFGRQASTAHLDRSHASVIKRRRFADERISPGRQRLMPRRLHTQQSPPIAKRPPRLQTNRRFVRSHPYSGARPWANPHAAEAYPPKPRHQQAGSGSPCVATQR